MTRLSDLTSKILADMPEADAQAIAWENERHHREHMRRERDREASLRAMLPEPLADATAHNFEIYDEAQEAVVDEVLQLQLRMQDHVRGGGGLIAYGPCGTGKDHLAASCIREAHRLGFKCGYVYGSKLYVDAASAWRRDSSEAAVIAPYLTFDVLLLSDPVLAVGMTDGNYRTLHNLVACRYDAGKPTWVTINCKGRDSAIQALTPPVFSRLRDKAVTLACVWGDYRERRTIG